MITRLLTSLGLAAALALVGAAPARAQVAPEELKNQLEEAERQLHAQFSGCKPIDTATADSLYEQAKSQLFAVMAVDLAGAPADKATVSANFTKASALAKRAHELAAQCKQDGDYQSTNVQKPILPQAEIFDPAKPAPVAATPVPDGTAMYFWRWLRDYQEAKEACDFGRMIAARAGALAADARTREVLKTAQRLGELSQFPASILEEDIRVHELQLARVDSLPIGPCPEKLDRTSSRILDIHNQKRVAAGAAPLVWNYELAERAADYAAVLAERGELVHAPREGRGLERENLQQGLPGWEAEDFMMGWLAEEAGFVPGVFPDVSRSGEVDEVLHYSQVIWPETTEIGCGKAMGHGFWWFVCRYWPGGNRPGVWVGLAPPPPPPPPPLPPPPPPPP